MVGVWGWGGGGIVWTVVGGGPRGTNLRGAAMAKEAAGGFTFAQISDSHIGFKAEANPDPTGTLQEALVRLKKYGPQSEGLADVYLPLFDEEPGVSPDEVAAEASRPALEETPQRKKKKHPGRQSLPADLPRVERIVACSPAECQCGQCGAETVVIGYDESERLDGEPAKPAVTVTRPGKRARAGR